MIKKFAIFSGSFIILNAFVCPPCICHEEASQNSKQQLAELQQTLLNTQIVPKVDKLIIKLEQLKQDELKQLNDLKQIEAIEKYKALQLKKIISNLEKEKQFLYLELKALANKSNMELNEIKIKEMTKIKKQKK